MDSKHFINTIKSLSIALIDDFRGFLVEDKVEGEKVIRRAEVPDDMLHIQIAFEEMSKVPGWKYVSGTGQNPITELMEEKRQFI